MTTEDCANFREDLAAYVLGALDAEGIPALVAHLRVCTACRTELNQFRRIDEGMLAALPPHTPSSAVRRKLQARLASTQKTTHLRPVRSFSQFALGGVLVLMLAFNLFSIYQLQSMQRQQSELAKRLETDQAALAMLAYAGTDTYPVSGTGVAGSLLLDKDLNTAVLIAWNLPALPDDKVYQVWLIDSQGGRLSGGLFTPAVSQPYTTTLIASPRPFTDFAGIGVTLEPAGGSPKPTGERVLKVDF
jgi:anti-sigma-K factor RskA